MFNMKNVGFKISELRKAKNMTQMELADKMDISFQAVSNWERGNSMPDISKLPELALLLGTTVDEVLGEGAELIDSALNSNIDGYLDNNTVTPKQLADIAPVLKPKQIDRIVMRSSINELDDIERLLPFISRDVIDELARKAFEDGKNIAELAPYVSREVIAEFAEIRYEKQGVTALEDIIPFISKDQLQKIAEDEYAHRGLRNFERIAPFLNREFLSGLAQEAIQREGIRAISGIAPFLDRDMLSKFVKEKYL